jgi:hypothetical protein
MFLKMMKTIWWMSLGNLWSQMVNWVEMTLLMPPALQQWHLPAGHLH